MALAQQSATIFSTCAKRQYCAIITDRKNRITGFGYNGGPRGYTHCKEGGCPRFLNNSAPGSNYDDCISVHAEANAILNGVGELHTLYVNGTPCHSCAKLITSTDIERVVYIRDPSYPQWQESHKLLDHVGITCVGMNERIALQCQPQSLIIS